MAAITAAGLPCLRLRTPDSGLAKEEGVPSRMESSTVITLGREREEVCKEGSGVMGTQRAVYVLYQQSAGYGSGILLLVCKVRR